MSVINQMLRDLDERRAPALAPAGTVPVSPAKALPQKRGRLVVWLMLLVAVMAAAAAFVFFNVGAMLRKDGPPIAQANPAPVAPPAVITPASAPASAPELPASEPVVPPAAVPPFPELVASAPMVVSGTQAPVVKADASSSAPAAGKFESNLALPRPSAATISVPPTPPAPASAPTVQARPQRQEPTASAPAPAQLDPAQRQLQAGRDALAQAQSLWNSGSRDAAVELLQQAMDVAQRNAAGAATPAANTLLVSLVREWSRMQLAEGRIGVVWETLTRMEPQLRGEPDLWAVRANAAQRLGRHQDSVHAYMVALESRPAEQRWLLGAAVSLAAMGKTESASEMAEKGRAAGPISREIQIYLRQMGVPLKE